MLTQALYYSATSLALLLWDRVSLCFWVGSNLQSCPCLCCAWLRGKIFANHWSEKTLEIVSGQNMNYCNLTSNSILKCAKSDRALGEHVGNHRGSTPEGAREGEFVLIINQRYQMASKHIRRCLISLVIREVQTNAHYHD